MQISNEDVALIKSLRKESVLQDLTEKELDQTNGLIQLVCADGDQFHDLYGYCAKISNAQRPTPRIHTFGLNGGALLLDASSPLNAQIDQATVLRHNLQVARQLKKIDTFAVAIHAPCGAAKLGGINLMKAIKTLLNGADLVSKENPGAAVKPLIHVDYGDGRKRTYLVSADKFASFKS